MLAVQLFTLAPTVVVIGFMVWACSQELQVLNAIRARAGKRPLRWYEAVNPFRDGAS